MAYTYTHKFEIITNEFSIEGELILGGGPDQERVKMPANELTLHQKAEVVRCLEAMMALEHCSADVVKVELSKIV